MLTVAYITSRRDNRIEWFFESLSRETDFDPGIHVLVIDHFQAEEGRRDEIRDKWERSGLWRHSGFEHRSPKPNVWNGPFRLPKDEWFAAASMRNTAICLCVGSHLAFVDDLSVVMPGWMQAVNEAIQGGYVGLGAYKKVRNLHFDNGVLSYEETEAGKDDRLRRVTQDVSSCDGGWCYGCSLVGKLEDFLTVGGFPEICDGLGSEDYCFGIALRNAGYHLKYDRRMMTLESEELHFVETPFKRTDKGVSPNDKSHAALAIAKGSKFYPNYFPDGMRGLRDQVLMRGGPFPVMRIPDRDWFDGQLIAEM